MESFVPERNEFSVLVSRPSVVEVNINYGFKSTVLIEGLVRRIVVGMVVTE